MRYIAKKKEDKFEVTGIKEMDTVKGKKVEVKFATKLYAKKELEDAMTNYEAELDGMTEKYQKDIMDMKLILKAIKEAE